MTKVKGRHCEERSSLPASGGTVAIFSGLHNLRIEQAKLFIQAFALAKT